MARTRKPLASTREFCRVCYYGINGTGKTTSAADMARLGEVAVIAAEPGLRQGRLAELGIPIENLQIALSPHDPDVPNVSRAELDVLFWDLRQEYQDHATHAPVGLMVDTTTEVQNVVTDEVRRDEQARLVRKEEDWDFADTFIDVQWHGIAVAAMNLYLRQFRDLPCHWALCAQEERREPFMGRGSTSIGPANSPGVQGSIMGYSDFVIRLQTMENPDDPKNPWRVGRTEHHDGIARAKDRDHVLPAKMAEPTFTRVLAYYRGELTAATDPIQQELDELLAAGALEIPDPNRKPRRVRASEQRNKPA